MPEMADVLERMRRNPQGIHFSELRTVCEHYFGPPRQEGTSHCVLRMPWAGDPRVNIQRGKAGMAKPYQVRQVARAVDRLKERPDDR